LKDKPNIDIMKGEAFLLNNIKRSAIALTFAFSIPFMSACGSSGSTSGLIGTIKIDGSSTVFPITQAVVENFIYSNRDVRIPVGVAGTGGGMKKFVTGEIDICNASRQISDSEKETAKKNGIDFVEFKVAYDGISVVVNKENNWIDSISTEDLKKIWEPNSKIVKWSDLNPSYPDEKIRLYGPGMDSGTTEYFTEEINKKKMAIRKDYTPSEDDNVLIQGVMGDKYSMGYFGFAFYTENKENLKVLGISTGKEAIKPSFDTIKNGSYKPLGRPLFIYVNKKSMEQAAMKEFLKYYFDGSKEHITEVGYVPLDDYSAEIAKIK